MKKYIIYIGILVAGLVLGKLFFGVSTSQDTEHNHNQSDVKSQMWTCSMHPQIMLPEPGDCPICGMELIPTDGGSEALGNNEFKLSENAMALANIQTMKVGTSKSVNNTIKLSGKIVVNEEANTVQVSYFTGRIETLNVNFTGEEINKGQLLATIYSPELIAAQQELITASSLKESQPELYQAVRNKLTFWKLSNNQINQIESSKRVQDNFPVYATVSGTVAEKLVAQGEAVNQGQPLFKIANLNSVWAEFDVYESNISTFKIGQDIVITTKSNPQKEYNAKVAFIDPVLNSNTRTVKLRVVLKNNTGEFKPGMFVEGNVFVGNSKKEERFVIPSTAVLWTGERSLVYVKTKANQSVFEMREITIGDNFDTQIEVLEGLKNGEEIVVNGTFTVDAAAQLRGKQSMMNTVESEVIDTLSLKRIKVPLAFQEQLKDVFNHYLKLKDGLVKDDFKTAKQSSKDLVENLKKVDMELISDKNTHMKWMVLENKIKLEANNIFKAKTIEKQRAYFKQLSLYVTNAIQIFGVNQTVYRQFCPMVNDNQGAYWLSLTKDIYNPYFGDAMLTCGSTKQIIE